MWCVFVSGLCFMLVYRFRFRVDVRCYILLYIYYYTIIIYYILYYTLLFFFCSLPLLLCSLSSLPLHLFLFSFSSFPTILFHPISLLFPFPIYLLSFLLSQSDLSSYSSPLIPFPIFILYVSGLPYEYLYSRLIQLLTPHVLSDGNVEWCSLISMCSCLKF